MTDTFDRSGRHGGSRQESPPRPPRASTRPAHDKTDPRPGRPGAGRACLRRARVSTQSVTIARAVRQRHTHSCMRAPCTQAAGRSGCHTPRCLRARMRAAQERQRVPGAVMSTAGSSRCALRAPGKRAKGSRERTSSSTRHCSCRCTCSPPHMPMSFVAGARALAILLSRVATLVRVPARSP